MKNLNKLITILFLAMLCACSDDDNKPNDNNNYFEFEFLKVGNKWEYEETISDTYKANITYEILQVKDYIYDIQKILKAPDLGGFGWPPDTIIIIDTLKININQLKDIENDVFLGKNIYDGKELTNEYGRHFKVWKAHIDSSGTIHYGYPVGYEWPVGTFNCIYIKSEGQDYNGNPNSHSYYYCSKYGILLENEEWYWSKGKTYNIKLVNKNF